MANVLLRRISGSGIANLHLDGGSGLKLGRNVAITVKNKKYSSLVPKSLDISGIYPPITTPFNKTNGDICYEKLKSNFEIWNKVPFKGYVVMGSNGESVSLSIDEKLELLQKARQLATPGKLIIAGVGLEGTQATIDLCQKAFDDKSADAALIITPSFYKGLMTDLVLRKHFEAIADKSPLPVILYSVPANTTIDLSVEVVIQLSKHPNIIGLKDSGGDITKISRIVYGTAKNDFQVLSGSAGFLLPSLYMGCTGGICALANVLGNEVCQVLEHFQNNQQREALVLQQKLLLPNLLVTRKLGVPGLKSVMDRRGLYGGPCRPPLLSLDEQGMKQLEMAFNGEGFSLL